VTRKNQPVKTYVDVFEQRAELNVPRGEARQKLDQVAERAAETIKPPDNEHVAGGAGFQRASEAEALARGAGDPVLEDFPASLTASPREAHHACRPGRSNGPDRTDKPF
jgi:hypothetical protein